jgi:Fe-S-cluster containining protein
MYNIPCSPDAVTAPFFERLTRLYDAMDRGYARAADTYGFHCDGCADNCCRTRFYHHTHLEYLFILQGVSSPDAKKQLMVQSRAAQVCRSYDRADEQGLPVRVLCPLNIDGRCILYAYRPMICRLHGIAHQLRKPGQSTIYGPGCATFDERCGDKPYFQFDRTPFYMDMVRLENEFKQNAGLTARIKMTISRMIATSAEGTAQSA